MKYLIIWAFIAGLLNGILMRIRDFCVEMEDIDAGQYVYYR